MSKFEAHPETLNYRNYTSMKEPFPGKDSVWLVLERDKDGFFEGSYSAKAKFTGPEAETHAKNHADLLNATTAMPIVIAPAKEEKQVCVHCFQDPSAHDLECPMISRTLKCTKCNIIYVGNLIEPCSRCMSTEHLAYYYPAYDPEIQSGNQVRKPETGNPRRYCLDCGAPDGEMHRPGCEAVARGERQMAELEAQLKDECKAGTAAQASYLVSVDPASEYSDGPDEDQPDTED